MSNFEEDAKTLAKSAVDHDLKKEYELAISYYLEASQALINAKLQIMRVSQNDSTSKYDARISEYLARAETLKSFLKSVKKDDAEHLGKTNEEKEIERVHCLLNEAIDEDENDNVNEAAELYMNAVELFLTLKKSQANQKLKSLEPHIKTAIERAEKLKGISKNDKTRSTSNASSLVNPVVVSKNSSFTKEELEVLRYSSTINGRNYLPFLSEIDTKEKFFFQIPFTDKNGLLDLSKTQKERFVKWVRPDEIYEQPKLMQLVSSFSVKQTCISDCSFIASLTVCAQYERKFNKRLLDQIIYPKNKNSEPILNPCGKYMVILHINGCQRKVIIDDYFPIDRQNNLLCSATTNKGELWVSLLEKAYMKVMGGYDFPGSNSNIDLNALTGWIPERLALHSEFLEFSKDSDFERMFERFHSGDCLITVATGNLSQAEEQRTGLVPTHAYACIDIRKFKDLRLFQLKNPWSHLRWKGNFSELDVRNWTPELMSALNYDPHMAYNVDNGVFWIDYESLLQFFDVFYISWNPKLFPFTTLYHRKWSVAEGPVKDRYNLGENPQYILKVKPNAVNKRCSTWILLTRHIVDKEDFAENKEYIAIIVYKNGGKRVFYPNEPEPFKEGVRINSPHYLVKLVDNEPGPIYYTLVLSQYEKSSTIYYSLRVYSTCEFELKELKDPYNPHYLKKISGKWSGKTAGGCSNHPNTYLSNPLYQIELKNNDIKNCVKIELRGPQQYSVGFEVTCVRANVESKTNFNRKPSGDYRKGFSVLELENIPGGLYQIRPSTFLQNQEGPFFLSIFSSHAYELNQLQ